MPHSHPSPRASWRRCVLLLAAIAAAPWASAAAQDANRVVTGRVRDTAGTPLADVTIRLSRDSTTLSARTDAGGRFRVTGLRDGRYTLSAIRLGFAPLTETVELTVDGAYRELTMTPRATVLDEVLVRAEWTGVRGIVFDARNLSPLANARVQLVGTDSVVRTDERGRFAIAVRRGRALVIRVEQPGFLPALRAATVPDGRYVEFDLPLDTAAPPPKDFIEQKDLQLRLKMAGTRSVTVTGDDLRRSGALSAKEAFLESTGHRRSGVRIPRSTCVFVNGRPRPGFPFDALRAADIEFLEAYAPDSDLSRTLQLRWPPGAPCGSPGPSEVQGSPRWRAEYVSVWLRDPN
jgi:hypothetical protein